MNNININNIICFYSKYSKISQEYLKLLQRQKEHNIDLICIDNKDIREKIRNDKTINITEVPCIIIMYSNEFIEKMSTSESYNWVKGILDKQIEKERYEYNLLIEKQRIQNEEERRRNEILEQRRNQELEKKQVFFEENLEENLQENVQENLKEKQDNKNSRNFKPKIQTSKTNKAVNITGLEQISNNIVSKSNKKLNYAKTVRNNKFKPTELSLLDEKIGNSSSISKLDDLTESEDEEDNELPVGVRSTPHNISSEQDTELMKGNKDLIKLKTEVIKPSQLEENHKRKMDNKLDSDDIIALAKQMEKDRGRD